MDWTEGVTGIFVSHAEIGFEDNWRHYFLHCKMPECGKLFSSCQIIAS